MVMVLLSIATFRLALEPPTLSIG